MTGTGSPIGSVADGTGSPIGQWRLVRGSASPNITGLTASISCSRVREATDTPGIWFAESPAPALHLLVVVPGVTAGPPVLAAVGGGSTTSLLRLRHDK